MFKIALFLVSVIWIILNSCKITQVLYFVDFLQLQIFINLILLMLFAAFYVGCIYSNALQTSFRSWKHASTMNPDQTAPKRAV